jgi:hypothetical protein
MMRGISKSRHHVSSNNLVLLPLCSTTAPFHIKAWFILFYFNISINPFSGGIVLWSRSFTPDAAQLASSSASPVNSLIREALIEGRTAEDRYEKDGYAVKWTFVNDLELIFVVSSLLNLKYLKTYTELCTGCVSADSSTYIC